MLKAGLVGCGNIGALYDEAGNTGDVFTHAGMYQKTKGIELFCAADFDTKRLQDFGSYWQVNRLYENCQERQRSVLLIVQVANQSQ